ncbi:MAG TPA: M48 family metalloprotease [Usitatibacter sp.]|nr:M48 family metalloprotease [Usitatibacter sp.]
MKRLLAVLAMAVAGAAGAEPLLECGTGLAFRPEAVASFAAHAYDRTLAAYRADGRLDRDPALLGRIERLVERLSAAAGSDSARAAAVHWQVHTCRRCGENASAMAGGRLMVGEEFIARLAPSDAELGYLLAHEMAHVMCEHTREFATVARYFEDNGMHRDYADIQRELDGSIGLQYRMEFVAEEQELEADRVGFFLGARAGFAPGAMMSLLAKLDPAPASSATAGGHPTTGRRLAQAASMLQAAQILYARGRAAHHMLRKSGM